MPKRDGWEATEMLESDDATSAMPIIALTAHAAKGDREEAMEADCDEYLTKPSDFDELERQIDRMIDAE